MNLLSAGNTFVPCHIWAILWDECKRTGKSKHHVQLVIQVAVLPLNSDLSTPRMDTLDLPGAGGNDGHVPRHVWLARWQVGEEYPDVPSLVTLRSQVHPGSLGPLGLGDSGHRRSSPTPMDGP